MQVADQVVDDVHLGIRKDADCRVLVEAPTHLGHPGGSRKTFRRTLHARIP